MQISRDALQPKAPAGSPPARRGLDRFEAAALTAFALISVWVLALDVWQVIAHGRVWTGTDGSYIVDQMQYLSWIRGAADHGLVPNLFVLRHTPADYLQPTVALSGILTALGVAPWLAYLLWKPVAIAALFFAARAYVNRSLPDRSGRRAALVLGLFAGSISVVYGTLSVVGDLVPGYLSWGYPFALISVAALLGALIAYDRGRAANRIVWAPAILGALASSLHPWQGETLIVIVVISEAVMYWRSWRTEGGWAAALRRLKLPFITVLATVAPLAYYVILAHTDLSWRLAREGSKHSFALWTVLLALVPLAVPAAFGFVRGPRGFLDTATCTWPIATLGVFIVSGTALSATPLHAFVGITFPLAVLAVRGVRVAGLGRIRRGRLVGAVAIAAMTIPATAFEMWKVRELAAPTSGNPNFIASGEDAALRYLSSERAPGGVLTRFYLGTVVPAITGRRTYVGHCLWSRPDCTARAKVAQRLLDGSLSPQAARNLVIASGARFVLSDCGEPADLEPALGPLVRSVRRFGCARVYVIRAS